MYHRIGLQKLSNPVRSLLIAAGLLQSFCCIPALSQAQPVLRSISSEPIELHLNVKEQLKKSPTGVELYEYDDNPLGNRRPILMVHGMRGEFWKDCFRWQKLVTYLSDDSAFRSNYKIYLVRYDSYAPISDLSSQFRDAVKQFSAKVAGAPITLVALSMGGSVVAEAMSDPQTDRCIERVLALGTPFHGSPLFTSSWMECSMLQWHKTPLTQLDTCLPYEIYFGKHENLLSGLNWDNSDGEIPDISNYRLWFRPMHPRSVSPTITSNRVVYQLNEGTKLNKDKFTVYGGYLENDTSSGKDPSFWAQAMKAPLYFCNTVVPEHAGKEHPVLRILNHQMAHAVPAGSSAGTMGYPLNDGITPVSSSLFLPNELMKDTKLLTDADIAKLRGLTDVHRARLFRNIDHLTFIDEYRPKGAPAALRDELSDSAEAKPIFAWILDDLVKDGQEESLAVGPKPAIQGRSVPASFSPLSRTHK